MKEYKYTIDGKEYKVEIGDIADNIANVTGNGEASWSFIQLQPAESLP